MNASKSDILLLQRIGWLLAFLAGLSLGALGVWSLPATSAGFALSTYMPILYGFSSFPGWSWWRRHPRAHIAVTWSTSLCQMTNVWYWASHGVNTPMVFGLYSVIVIVVVNYWGLGLIGVVSGRGEPLSSDQKGPKMPPGQ